MSGAVVARSGGGPASRRRAGWTALALLSLLPLAPASGVPVEPRPVAAPAPAKPRTLPPASRSARAPLAPGPIPDFAPLSAVLTHRMLEGFDPAIPAALGKLAGRRHRVEPYDPCGRDPGVACEHWPPDGMMIWMRDYQPIFVRRPDGRLKIVRYLSQNPNRTGYVASIAARVGRARAHPLLAGRSLAAGRRPPIVETLPLIHEHGNLVTTGRHVFLTHRVLDENAVPSPDPHLTAAGYRARAPQEVVALLARALERPESDLVILPPLPGEQTGHIDLYVMALDPETVLIPAIPAEGLLATEVPLERALGLDAAAFLDQQAALVASLGLRVERLPMLPPALLPPYDGAVEEPNEAVFFTPTNGLLLRTPQSAAVLLPAWDAPGRSPAYRALNERFRDQWAAFFRSRGWTPHFLDGARVGRRGGFFRCVTAVVPL